MIHNEIFAHIWRQALLAMAGTTLQLHIAGGAVEISCRAAYIMDIALEIRQLC